MVNLRSACASFTAAVGREASEMSNAVALTTFGVCQLRDWRIPIVTYCQWGRVDKWCELGK